MQTINPSSILSPYIKQYWTMTSKLKPGDRHVQRIIPNGFVEMVFYLRDVPTYNRDKKEFKSKTMVSGQQDGYYDIIVTGKLDLLSVVFKPQGAKVFFDIPLNELLNQSIPAHLLLKTDLKELEQKLSETVDLKQRVAMLENYLLTQLRKRKEYEFKRIADSVNMINRHWGIASVDSLASRACLSKKQYERTFSHFVGIAPKKFLRVIRFQSTLYTQQRNKRNSLTHLAYDSGYYDQSHMINDFKHLTGLTPKQFLADCEPYSDYFTE